jgi:hypothetical protein
VKRLLSLLAAVAWPTPPTINPAEYLAHIGYWPEDDDA